MRVQTKASPVSRRALFGLGFLTGLLVMGALAAMIATAPKERHNAPHAHLSQTNIGPNDFDISKVAYEDHTYLIAHKTRESRVDVGIGMSMIHDPNCQHRECRRYP